MANPAPFFLEEKVITVIDGHRIESYSPGFVRVLDIAKYGDAPADGLNSLVRPVSDFAGNAEVNAYTAETEKIRSEYHEKIAELHKNAKFGLKARK